MGTPNPIDEEGQKPMNTSFFWLAELPKLAEHPPEGGLQFLSNQTLYPCEDLMADVKSYVDRLQPGSWEVAPYWACRDLPTFNAKNLQKTGNLFTYEGKLFTYEGK